MSKKRKNINREFIQGYKQDRCCATCGWKEHPEILHFHHHQGNKEYEVSDLLRNSYSIKTVKAEISKCILLCPNCHQWFHYNNPINQMQPKLDLHIYNDRWQQIFN